MTGLIQFEEHKAYDLIRRVGHATRERGSGTLTGLQGPPPVFSRAICSVPFIVIAALMIVSWRRGRPAGCERPSCDHRPGPRAPPGVTATFVTEPRRLRLLGRSERRP